MNLLFTEDRKVYQTDGLFVYNVLNTYSDRIAAFDLDNTLISTRSNKIFAKNKNDWKLKYTNTRKILIELYKKNYSIIIITNKNGIGSHISLQDFIDKCENIMQTLSIPITFYISLKKKGNKYRKPNIGIFELHKKTHKIDINNSFYVGDAWCKKECWSDSDLQFAKNCNIKFIKEIDFFE